MGFFSSISSSINASEINSVTPNTHTDMEKLKGEERELTKKIAAAKIEVENFSLELDEDFFDNTINKIRD